MRVQPLSIPHATVLPKRGEESELALDEAHIENVFTDEINVARKLRCA
jgi:hypothetical protein